MTQIHTDAPDTSPEEDDDPFADGMPEDEEDDGMADAFGAEDDDSGCDDDDLFELDPVPVGVLNGFVAECKRNPKNKAQIILEVQIDTPEYEGVKVAAFIDTKRFLSRFMKICALLGVPFVKVGKQVGPRGGLKALKGKSALWVVSTYRKEGEELAQASIAWGRPNWDRKAKQAITEGADYYSEEWSEWEKANPLDEAQAKALLNCQGCLSSEEAELF